ncbi:MAG TPA: DUF1707 domain-containing protein [Solirubrobacterales bacterium]|nr:DUF1707 domain-containing protein [Solirubrobacterales bacterium]
MSTQPGLRIGDADRERAQAKLADHYAAGRLDKDEYDQRLDQIWAARTRAELAPVFRDLPGAPRPPGRAPYSTAAGRARFNPPPSRSWASRLPTPLLVLLVVIGVAVALANLPLILIGLGVWFFFFRGGGCGARRVHRSRHW